MKVVFRPAARRDILLQIGHFIDQQANEAATRFPDAVQDAVAFLMTQPDAGSPRESAGSRLPGLRSWPVPGFEDTRIYYLRPQPGLIRIVRVLHGKRDLHPLL